MDTHIRPLDKLSINEVCKLAKGAAYRGVGDISIASEQDTFRNQRLARGRSI